MKICVAQTRPFKGDIQNNIDKHKELIDLAISNGANMIVFPELSITGYEPELAEELATHKNDNRFDDFQKISDTKQITIGVGVPIRTPTGIYISLVIFQPQKARQLYSKQYLHSDEEPFFVSGQNATGLIKIETNIALAICYELSVPQHSENAFKSGAEVYIASVVKSIEGVEKAIQNLSNIANKYAMTVLMANCIGECDGYECGGKTSIWNNKGVLVGQLDDTHEGILMIDTNTQAITQKVL
jgi:predicted amidohydrolase